MAISLEIGLFFVAIKHTTVANVTLFGSLAPLVLLGVAARRFGETITRFLAGVTAVAVAGVVLAVFGSTQHTSWNPRGDSLALAAMFLFAAYLGFAKQGRATAPALEFQAWIWIVGTVTLAPFTVVDAGGIDLPSPTQWVWIAILLAVPGTGHMLMNWAHPRVRLVITSMLTLALPVLSTVGAIAFLDESVGIVQMIGMAMVLGALAIVVEREATLVPPDPPGTI